MYEIQPEFFRRRELAIPILNIAEYAIHAKGTKLAVLVKMRWICAQSYNRAKDSLTSQA